MTAPWPPLLPKPQGFTAEERAGLNPNPVLNPAQKRAGLAMLAKAFHQQLSTHPALQPLNVEIEVRPEGFSLIVDIPPGPAPDQIALPDGNGQP